VCIYIYKIITVHPHILCKHKLLFWMRLIAINRCPCPGLPIYNLPPFHLCTLYFKYSAVSLQK